MRGAGNAESTEVTAWRVGVLGTESENVDFSVKGARAILEPDLGDGRNYFNAAMCDAAIAFEGGDGTNSEVAFAMALGRPVVLVGPAWDTSFPPGEDSDAREALIRSAKIRVKGDDGSALAGLVTRAYAALLVAEGLMIERCALEHSATEVAARARELADEVGLHGDVPSLPDRPDLEPLTTQYRAWLADIGHFE